MAHAVYVLSLPGFHAKLTRCAMRPSVPPRPFRVCTLQIPDMLGVVLSSSKYGVRQARGKYGMGAKMALIWSKKSTGLPIQVRLTATTSHVSCLMRRITSMCGLMLRPGIVLLSGALSKARQTKYEILVLNEHLRPVLHSHVFEKVLSGCSLDQDVAPGFLTKCVLDIDIYKNRPSVHEHVKQPNPEVRSGSS